MRILKAGGALIALALLLVGVPWVLLEFTHPAHLLTVDWGTALTVGADSRLIVALLGAVGWLAWAMVAATTVFEALAVLSRQRIRIRVPGTGWLRPALGALVLAAAAAPTMASADGGAAAPPVDAPRMAPAVTAESPASAPGTAVTGRAYVVQPGDELWAIAEQELGSGERWREIVALNEGVSDVSRLQPGTRLALPAEPAESSEPTVVVERGDTLWHIAEEHLGDPHRWPEIYAANRDQVADPDSIDVGWELRLPGAEQGAIEVAPEEPAEPVEEEVAAHTQEQAAAQAVSEAFGHGFPVQAPAPESAPTGLAAEETTTEEDTAEGPAVADLAAAEDLETDDYAGLLTPVGAALAGAVLVGVGVRRRAQVLARAVGRRLVPVPANVARFWTALANKAEDPTPRKTEAAPTTLVLGWDGEEPVELEAEAERAIIFTGPEAGSALGAAVTGLACAPWSAGVEVTVVDGEDWVRALDDPQISGVTGTAEGLSTLSRLCSERRLALRSLSLVQMRADADHAEAFAPTVVVFLTPLDPAQLDAVGDALALGEVGVSVLASTPAPLHLPLTQVRVEPDQASLRGRSFAPQLVTAPARRALVKLFTATSRTDTEQAPWWKTDDDLPPNVLPLPRYGLDHRPEERPMTTSPSHPTLLLLGDVKMAGASGPEPTRAVGQCLEYCAWLLQHPGGTPTRMLQDLQIADTTRRSNMSRLRTWLGTAPDAQPYLPDAYSGRLSLDERVSSDWERFSALLSGGVNLASSGVLRDALALVRGEPLGTFAFQWHWASGLQADMVAMIVDAACVLADRALDQGDLELARWAVAQGRLGAPFDDALGVREIEALSRSGRRSEADHAVVRLNRALRAEGRDLDPALAIRVQSALQPHQRRAADTRDR